MGDWTIEYEGERFEKFLFSLPPYEQAVLIAAVTHVLAVHGIDICSGEWGKSLGDGLYEFRVRKSLGTILQAAALPVPDNRDERVLLRVFCTFYGNKVVLLFSGYNKGKDPSERRQQREIRQARKIYRAWKSSKAKPRD